MVFNSEYVHVYGKVIDLNDWSHCRWAELRFRSKIGFQRILQAYELSGSQNDRCPSE